MSCWPTENHILSWPFRHQSWDYQREHLALDTPERVSSGKLIHPIGSYRVLCPNDHGGVGVAVERNSDSVRQLKAGTDVTLGGFAKRIDVLIGKCAWDLGKEGLVSVKLDTCRDHGCRGRERRVGSWD